MRVRPPPLSVSLEQQNVDPVLHNIRELLEEQRRVRPVDVPVVAGDRDRHPLGLPQSEHRGVVRHDHRLGSPDREDGPHPRGEYGVELADPEHPQVGYGDGPRVVLLRRERVPLGLVDEVPPGLADLRYGALVRVPEGGRDETAVDGDRHGDVDVLLEEGSAGGVVGGVHHGVLLDSEGYGLGEESRDGDALGLHGLVEGIEFVHVYLPADPEDGHGERELHVLGDGPLHGGKRR
mmetsp:Transcript_19589/g.38946  ORF Transcript_19589/g.38946 Transcript_19589/m.38946 type:complete len:235 (+) Transcript_19589:54-758(+)